MKFFFPDAQDLVDPSFDFEKETRSDLRVRQRDDHYAHEVFTPPPFDGMLVSKGIVDGLGGGASAKYTIGQRNRLLRSGARAFFRLEKKPLEMMGDCGAFSYVKEEVPPYTVDEVIEFYEDCGFNYGISVDHVILAFEPDLLPGMEQDEYQRRQDITLQLATEFKKRHEVTKARFKPMGVAQGWSPASYARSVSELQKMGYDYIALGGMVPLKTHEILLCLESIDQVRKPGVGMHLLGVTRIEHLARFAGHGVVSFDSTSPLMQAFKDETDNYYTLDGSYMALRVPQVEGNPKLQRAVSSGVINQDRARKLELQALDALSRYDRNKADLEEAVDALAEYERLHDGKKDRSGAYRQVLADRPWKACPCEVCQQLGIHVMLFRGAERNRRRGFHNVYVFAKRLKREIARAQAAPAA